MLVCGGLACLAFLYRLRGCAYSIRTEYDGVETKSVVIVTTRWQQPLYFVRSASCGDCHCPFVTQLRVKMQRATYSG